MIIFAGFIVSLLIAMDENDLNSSDHHAPTNSKSSSYLDKRLGADLDINDTDQDEDKSLGATPEKKREEKLRNMKFLKFLNPILI